MSLLLLSLAPADWVYAGPAIDPDSVAYVDGDVVFRTVGDGLVSGPVEGADAAALACGGATRATVTYVDGVPIDVVTFPENPCVERAALALDAALSVEGTPLEALGFALVVLDVPATEAACSRS